MRRARILLAVSIALVIIIFLAAVPLIRAEGCPQPGPLGCKVIFPPYYYYQSVTKHYLGFGAEFDDFRGYSISVPNATPPVRSTSSVSYTVTAGPTYTTTAITDSKNDLKLQLSLNVSSTSSSGVNVSIAADEYNTLASTNNVTATENWRLLPGGPPCQPPNYPVGLAIATGHYSASNITSAKFLGLINPGATYACSAELSRIDMFQFQPFSNIAAIYGSCNPNPCMTEKISSEITASGYWNQSGVFTNFPRGVYTVVGADEWGYVAIAYFAVS